MGCKGRLDPREVLRRIIKNIIQRNLRLLDNQVRLLRTYDLAVWESLSQGFIRANKFVKLSRKIFKDDKFEAEAREIIQSLFDRALRILRKGKNPDHRARALGKLIRTGILMNFSDINMLLDQATESLEEIESKLDRVKTASYLLFEVGRAINMMSKEEKANSEFKEFMPQLEKFAQSVYEKIITCISMMDKPEERAKALAYLAEGIRDLSIVVKRENNKVEWLDVHEAELAAQESLKEAESVNDFYVRGVIKSYVAYLYYTLSLDLRDKAEVLYEEAVELAIKNSSKNEKDASDLLGQIAFTKALTGQEGESETLFQEACIIALRCPDPDNILTALKIADLAGKSRMIRTAGELLDQYIIPAIRSIKDEIKRAALMAVAADAAAWVDMGWGARLAVSAAEDLWMYSPEDLKDGKDLYLLALGAVKAAFADADSAWRILDFILSILRSDLVRLPFFIDYISLEWFGKAYRELKTIPSFLSVFKKELREYLNDLRKVLDKATLSIVLADLAYGIGDSDKKYVIKLLDEAIKNAAETNMESKVFGKVIKAAYTANLSLVESYMNEVLKRAEQLNDFDETISYLLDVLEELIDVDFARKFAKIIVDIVSEASVKVKSSKIVNRFIRLLKKIDVAWANEIQDLIREQRGFIDKSNRAYSGVRRREDY